jgi:calcium-dependent protein kinase
MDTNRDGVIDYDEFMTAAADREKLLTSKNLKNAFNALDKNGNGKVDAEEIKAAFA